MDVQVVPLRGLRVASPSRRRAVAFLLLGTVVFVGAGLVGRATIVDGRTLSLVWPATGVAMLMTGACARRDRPLALLLVAVAAYVLNALTGVTPLLSVVFVLSNVTQALVGGLLLSGAAPRLLGRVVAPADATSEEAAHGRVADVGAVMLAAVAGSFVGALTGSLGMAAVLGTWSWADAAVWWGRNSAGGVVVLLTVLLLGSSSRAGRTATPGGRLELTALVGVSAALYLVVFWWFPSAPLAFPLLVPTVWVGLRFAPRVVALHGAAVTVLVVALTVSGHGPFVDGQSWHQEALVSQSFVVIVVGLGLLLALGRAERTALTENLARARNQADTQALMLSAVIDSMHDGLSVVARDGRVLVRNPSGALLAGASSVADTSVRQYVVHGPDGRRLDRAEYPQTRVFDAEGGFHQEVVLRFHDGSPDRTLSVTGRRLPSVEEGEEERAVLVYHDVTAERRQRVSLESFAGVVAHDLRGPLGVLDGWTELLDLEVGDGPTVPTEVVRPKVDRIRQAVVTMQRLIQDLLESSTARDQAGRGRVVDLDGLTRQVAADLTEQARSRGDAPAPQIEVDALPPVHADPALVRQLLVNLVSNAVKYVVPGETPEIRVSARTLEDRVELSVVDRGIGIPLPEREAVFEAFHRAPTRATYDGHGIGLSVCRRIVEGHGGRIVVAEPVDGRGTRVVLTLPAAPEGRPAPAA